MKQNALMFSSQKQGCSNCQLSPEVQSAKWLNCTMFRTAVIRCPRNIDAMCDAFPHHPGKVATDNRTKPSTSSFLLMLAGSQGKFSG